MPHRVLHSFISASMTSLSRLISSIFTCQTAQSPCTAFLSDIQRSSPTRNTPAHESHLVQASDVAPMGSADGPELLPGPSCWRTVAFLQRVMTPRREILHRGTRVERRATPAPSFQRLHGSFPCVLESAKEKPSRVRQAKRENIICSDSSGVDGRQSEQSLWGGARDFFF